MKAWIVLGLAAAVAGCVPVDRDPAREVFGVSAASGADVDTTHDAAAQKLLAWKAAQFCTESGYDVEKRDVEPAEDHQQILDWQLRCRPYTAMTPVQF